ncbi:MAG: hypothetical protein OXE17_01740 [Chloroflexi bacterium]|nr:hypothetical protein [Chloroflexota bacterium]
MRNRQIGETINIGWPDYGRAEQSFTIVDLDQVGQVFRARVTDGNREGGFLVIYNCPDVVLEQLAEQATNTVGFRVIVSSLRCSIDGDVLRSFDYEWYPTPEYAERPRQLATALADLLSAMRGGSGDSQSTN